MSDQASASGAEEAAVHAELRVIEALRQGDEAAFARLITLPLFPTMSDDDTDDVVAALRKVLGHYLR